MDGLLDLSSFSMVPEGGYLIDNVSDVVPVCLSHLWVHRDSTWVSQSQKNILASAVSSRNYQE